MKQTLIDRFLRIKNYMESDCQPEIDHEINRDQEYSLTSNPQSTSDGDAESRDLGPLTKEVYFDNDSAVEEFFVKYEDCADPTIVTIKEHLISVIGDIQYLKEEARLTNDQFALDYLDALNELSTAF